MFSIINASMQTQRDQSDGQSPHAVLTDMKYGVLKPHSNKVQNSKAETKSKSGMTDSYVHFCEFSEMCRIYERHIQLLFILYRQNLYIN